MLLPLPHRRAVVLRAVAADPVEVEDRAAGRRVVVAVEAGPGAALRRAAPAAAG